MTDLLLYHYPGTCAEVSVFAFEQSGLPYDRALVDIGIGAQNDPPFANVNPMSKVPALLVNGKLLTETIGILTYIVNERPNSGVFPLLRTTLDLAECYSGLSFCASNLHPLVRGMSNPKRITAGDVEDVRNKSFEVAARPFSIADTRLRERGWWLDDVSVVDVYLAWAVEATKRAGFNITPYPQLSQLSTRLAILPAYRRMQAIEEQSREILVGRQDAQIRQFPN